MSTLTEAREVTSAARPRATQSAVTPLLLYCGPIAGALFIAASLVQALMRDGFDLRRHAISMLLLGDGGWIQNANFEMSGVLVLACAVGIARALRPGRAALWAALLFGTYGLGLIVAGIFPPDPALGFPPGAPADMPTQMSAHAAVHTVAFFVSFLSLIGACFVFGAVFGRRGVRGWARYSVLTGLAPLPFIALSLALGGSGVTLFIMGVITSAWVAAVPLRLRCISSVRSSLGRQPLAGVR